MKFKSRHLVFFYCLLVLMKMSVYSQFNNGRPTLENNEIYRGELLQIQLEKELRSDPQMILPFNFPQTINRGDDLHLLITTRSINNSVQKVDEVLIDLIPLDPISGGGGTNPILVRPTDPDNGFILYENVIRTTSEIPVSSMFQLRIIVVRGNEVIVFTAPRLLEVLTVRHVKVYPVPFESTLNFDFTITDHQEQVSLEIITSSGNHSIIRNTVYRAGRHTFSYEINQRIGSPIGYSLSIGSKIYKGNLIGK